MIPDAASSVPRKRGRKAWLVGLACVVAVVTIVLLATPPKPEPVRVWFVRATNESGVKRLVFEGTNGMTKEIPLSVAIITGGMSYAKTLAALPNVIYATEMELPARASFHFTLSAPQKGVPYDVVWDFEDDTRVPTRWERFRSGCCNFLIAHGMRRLAARFEPTPRTHIIPSTEIKE